MQCEKMFLALTRESSFFQITAQIPQDFCRFLRVLHTPKVSWNSQKIDFPPIHRQKWYLVIREAVTRPKNGRTQKCVRLVLESLINNWMVRVSWGLGASGVGSKVWVLTIGVLVVNPERDSVWDGLWRPGGAFFQIGLGCVMSHHNKEGLCTFLFKSWRENSKWSSC